MIFGVKIVGQEVFGHDLIGHCYLGVLHQRHGNHSSRCSNHHWNDRCPPTARSNLWMFGPRCLDRDAKGISGQVLRQVRPRRCCFRPYCSYSLFSSGSYTVNPDSSVSIIAEEAAALADFDKEVTLRTWYKDTRSLHLTNKVSRWSNNYKITNAFLADILRIIRPKR